MSRPSAYTSLGYVYFVKAGGRIKIGQTKRLAKRMSNIQSASPYDIELVGTIRSPQHKDLERQIQNEFSRSHCKGEWYNISEAEALKAIKVYSGTVAEGTISSGLKNSSEVGGYSHLLSQ